MPRKSSKASAESVAEPEPAEPEAPTPPASGPSPDPCIARIEQGVEHLKQGQYVLGVQSITAGLECLFGEFVNAEKQRVLRDAHAIHGRLKALGEKIEQA